MKLSQRIAKQIGPFAREEAVKQATLPQRLVIKAIPWPLVILLIQLAIELYTRFLAREQPGAVMGTLDRVLSEADPDLIARYDLLREEL